MQKLFWNFPLVPEAMVTHEEENAVVKDSKVVDVPEELLVVVVKFFVEDDIVVGDTWLPKCGEKIRRCFMVNFEELPGIFQKL